MQSSVLNSQISYVYDSKDKHNASIKWIWRTKSESKDKKKNWTLMLTIVFFQLFKKTVALNIIVGIKSR